jgi:uncharacterized protein DUF732
MKVTEVLLGGVIAAALSILQPAHAAADPDNDFLARLNWYGIDLSAVMGSQKSAINMGHSICDDLHRGMQVKDEITALYRMLPIITDKQAGNLVSAAQFALCPDTLS